MEDIIQTDRLSKQFKEVKAVTEISLNVRRGEIYGFLGLNGAGKTTTIRMLLGMINPTHGQAFINGKKVYPGNTALWKDVGYLVEVPYAYPELTVRENLEITRRLRLLPGRDSVQKVMDLLKLTPYADRKAQNLSLGNAQRLGLAKALIHQPKILLLDEPANGLDPAGIFEIREMLGELAGNQGVTVFISSHILGEISRFATRIGIIHNGALIQEINTPQLELLCRKKLLLNTPDNLRAIALLKEHGLEAVGNHGGLLEISDGASIDNPGAIATLLVNAQLPPAHLSVAEEDLESYFLRTINEKGGAK
ncbi:MAG: ABC transporter ATP-binding protein [Lentimicrobium sp.]